MLDFSKFKKVAEDEKTVTMRHEKGHEMRILLKSLRPIEREQIKRIKLADGGKVQKFADNEDTVRADDSSDQSSQAAPDKSITINVGQPAPQAPLAQPAPVAPAPAPKVAAAPAVATTQNAGNPTEAALTQSKALQLGQQAGNTQQAVDAAKAQGSIPIAQQQQQNAIANAQRIDNTAKDFQQHTQDMARYLLDPKNSDPRAFYENMGVPQKISTALGLILGGFKQGLVGGNNPAYDWLKDQQEKDIAAQRARAENQKTVWGAYNSLYGNENVSTELAKKSWNDKLAADANLLAARLGTPQAAINNQKFQADLLKSGYDNLQKAAFIANQPQGPSVGQSQGPGASIEPSGNKKPTYGPESADKTGVYNIKELVSPDADTKLKQIQQRAAGGDPAAAADLPVIMSQLADARQRDEKLKQAPDLYRALTGNATQGGWLGRNIGHTVAGVGAGAGEAIGGLKGAAMGAAIGEGLGAHVGDAVSVLNNLNRRIYAPEEKDEFRKEEDYNTARSQLSDYLRQAYPGTSSGEIESKLQGILTDKTSEPENVTKHMKSFEDLVKAGGRYDALERWGMLNK